MVKLLLLRFWPVILVLALILMILVLLQRSRRAQQEDPNLITVNGEKKPPLPRHFWNIAISVTFIVLVLCFVGLIYEETGGKKHDYEPARMEDGKLVPAQVE